MSMAVSDFDAEWLLGGNMLCNILMSCYKCFFYICTPNHNNFTSNVEGLTFRVQDFRFRVLG